jgi:hypothetical protein
MSEQARHATPPNRDRHPAGCSFVKRLTDLPMLWSEQWRALGLRAPIQLQAEPS